MQHEAQTRALLQSLIPQKPRTSSYIPAHPWHLESAYTRSLQRRVSDPLMRITWAALEPVVMRYRAPSERTDDDDDFLTAIGKAQIRFGQQVDIDKEAEDAPAAMAPQVEAFTLAQQRKALRVLGIDAIGQDLFKAHARADWTQANVALIRSIPAEYFPKVQTHILDAIAQGMRHTTLAKHLKENVIPLADSRAQLIARDQVSKYNGQLARYQQQAVGLEQYEWRAVNDRRTRQTHLDQDGEVYRWDTPTPIGFPGSQIQCRCQSVPVL